MSEFDSVGEVVIKTEPVSGEIGVKDGKFVVRVGDEVIPAELTDNLTVQGKTLVTRADGSRIVLMPEELG